MREFIETVWAHYDQAGRHDLPWRLAEANGAHNPYKIWLSEIMLQQTQVPRVRPKFAAFLNQFPDVATLAQAPLSDVLVAWSGLGYNRRAKFLWQAAQNIQSNFDGHFPQTKEELVSLPGIGANTAGAILAYAYNQPVIFIETNIRSVFIYHFFADEEQVSDKQLEPLLQEAMDLVATDKGRSPRLWYWALMDYGTHLKQQAGNAARRSKHYTKQSTFEGSRRQLRGKVLKLLGEQGIQEFSALQDSIPDDRLQSVLNDLAAEGFVQSDSNRYQLASA